MKRIFILLLVCFCCQIYAQELTVQSFTELTNDLSARTALRLDNNDIPCALVKVELPLIGVQFDQSNQIIGNASYKVNTYWAYMPKGSKHLTISHPNFHTLDIVFADYGISYLNSATTYIVKVNVPERASQTLQPTQQYVVFNVTPADANATLELDGQSVQLTDGHGSKRMPFGTYSYKVQAVMYKTASGNITIQDPQNKHVVNISLLPNFGYVSIPNNGQNQGTEVYIDGKREGTIPFMSNRIQAGQHTIRLVNPYYQEVSETLVIEEGKTTTYNPTIIPLFGYIEVPSSSTLVGAEVYINGEYMGRTPYKSKKLKTGQYLVRVSKAQYNSAEQNLKVELGKTTTFTKQLISNFASIDLSVGKNAEIWIDDIKRGNGSWSGTLEAGAHLVECKLPNHRQTSKEIMIVANAPQTIPLETPIAIVGSLDISTNNVLEATIYLDGEVVGTTPMIIPNVIVGQHKLQIKKEGYANYEKTITIKEEDNNLNINLSPQVATKPGESKQAILQSAPTDITFEKLFTQPHMQKCNVFTSSLKEIAEETNSKIKKIDHTEKCIHDVDANSSETFYGCKFECTIYDNGDNRNVRIGIYTADHSTMAKKIISELKKMGFEIQNLNDNGESKNYRDQTVRGTCFRYVIIEKVNYRFSNSISPTRLVYSFKKVR
ncbi:MAG: PEGA domain-containing protein [Prevotellaceae bacterium]|nr:PEGA domain-containing protein [Candidatus Faecinaster equi]